MGFIFGAIIGFVVGMVFGPIAWSWIKSNVEKNQNQSKP